MKVGFLILLSGCAQLLGLDNTKLDQLDAPVDASSVCDGDPSGCTASTGRSACGQIFGTGATAGLPLRVAAPTGGLCDATKPEGPCALAVAAVPVLSLFEGTSNGEVVGQIDDCGRFAVGDIDTSVIDVALRFSDVAGVYQPSATLVLARTPIAGEADRGIAAFAVLKTTTEEWATQLSLPIENTSTGYLVKYTSTNGTPVTGEAVAIDSGSPLMSPPGTIPWAAYFAGDAPFSTLDPTATVTAGGGTAFAAMPAGPFSLEGFRQGRRCKIENLRTVGNVLIHVVEEGC